LLWFLFSFSMIIVRGVEVAAASVDTPEISEKLRRRLDLPIRMLSDLQGVR
jgi:hypothetical protein